MRGVTGGRRPSGSAPRCHSVAAHRPPWLPGTAGTCQDGWQDVGTASPQPWEPTGLQPGGKTSPQASACQQVPGSGVLPGHRRAAEVPGARLAPPAMQACRLLPEQTAPPASHALSCATAASMGLPTGPGQPRSCRHLDCSPHSSSPGPPSKRHLGILGGGRRWDPARGVLHRLSHEASAGSKLLLAESRSSPLRLQ